MSERTQSDQYAMTRDRPEETAQDTEDGDHPEPGRRFPWVRQMMRQHPILSRLMIAYLALSAVEFVRILLYDRPREYDAGFYQWETQVGAEGERTFHWTRGSEAHVLRPLWGRVVRMPFYLAHPDPPPDGVRVKLSVNEHVVHEQRIQGNGWHDIDLYLPAVLGADPWRTAGDEMALAGVAELVPIAGREPFLEAHWTLVRKPDYIRVFTDWHRPPGPPSTWFKIEVEPTFRPSDHVETDDDRDLGIGLGELLWLPDLPDEGLGFYEWEGHEGRPFRWSRATASARVTVGDATDGMVHIRVADPSAGIRPVPVRVFWNTDLVFEAEVGDNEWQEIRLAATTPHPDGVLTVHVGRTWSPGRAGVSADARELGVAVSRASWGR